MQRITVTNFGPIVKAELDIDSTGKCFVFIGRQASGKSTVAKSVYFCRSVRRVFVECALKTLSDNIDVNECFRDLRKRLSTLFISYFGTTKHYGREWTPITYDYDVDKGGVRKLDITIGSDGMLHFNFASPMYNAILNFFAGLSQHNKLLARDSLLPDGINVIQRLEYIKKEAERIFCDSAETIFVPASRSVLSVLPDALAEVQEDRMDAVMRDFARRTSSAQRQFSDGVAGYVDYRRQIDGEDVDDTSVEIAIELIKNVLHAEYRFDGTESRIYYDDDRYVKLMYASSGQQEALWVLLLLLIAVVEGRRYLFIIEEPEAHLFPNAQFETVKIIAMAANISGSSIFFTTHSPYTLTSLNLLIQSATVEGDGESIVDIAPSMRLDPASVGAFMVEDGVLRSLIDSETGLIEAFEIDGVSTIINERSDALTEKELRS